MFPFHHSENLGKIIAEKEFLSALIESSEDAVIGESLQGIITFWNKAAEDLFGYSAADALGREISFITPPGRQEEERDISRQVQSGKSIRRLESVRMCKGGRIIDVWLSVSPIYDARNNIVGASRVIRDITEQKTAERKLKEAHKFMEDTLNHIPDPIFMKDRQHRWTGGNNAFWELMEGPPEKFIGKSDYEFFSKEEADVFWEKDNKVFTSGEVNVNEEMFTDAQGRKHVLSTKKQAFLNERNEQFLLGVIRDITQIREAETALRNYTSELERSNRELDDFAYIVSHDLKEPLRGLIMQSNFLLEDLGTKLGAEGRRRLLRMTELAQRMEQLVSDLLYYSRLGRTELAVREVDLNIVVRDIEQMTEAVLKERGARIIIPRSLPKVVCDKPRITEVFRNLICNAIKHNDKAEPVIEIGFLETGASAKGSENNVFYVKDNGPGIDPRYHNDIFRIFKRMGNLSSNAGTGVGLTFVKKIIERHQGRVWVDSTLGNGATFYFTIGGKK